MLLGEVLTEYLCGTFVSEDFPWTIVDEIDHSLDLLFADHIKVCPFWKISSEHTIGVLIASSLPRVIWTSEIDSHMEDFGDLSMLCKLTSIVER